jgi:tRNA threonylcarbamoyladenosine biosynthesis protein TsaE
MKELKFASSQETRKWAQDFARQLPRPALILLDGEMGAGKTQLVKWFVEGLGGKGASSPTFAVHQSYEAPSGAIDHVDLYRMESAADLESTGFWDLFHAPKALVFVEWAGRLSDSLWPREIQKFHLEIAKDGAGEGRRLSIR